MKERVSFINGAEPVLIVCPHGHKLDDENTNTLSERLAHKLKAHAVINHGWRRSDKVDELASLANCNNHKHCKEPVVKDEFLDPIVTAITDITEDMSYDTGDPWSPNTLPLVLMIHGIGNSVRKRHNVPALDIVVGFGNGSPMRNTCTTWRREAMVDLLSSNFATYEGAAGGPYSAHSYTNMTQAIHRECASDVLQLELIYDIRRDSKAIDVTVDKLAKVVEAVLNLTTYKRPAGAKVKEI